MARRRTQGQRLLATMIDTYLACLLEALKVAVKMCHHADRDAYRAALEAANETRRELDRLG